MVVRNYNDWYLVHKEALAEKIRTEDHRAGSELTSEIVRYSHLRNHLLAEDHDTVDIIIACDDDGELDDMAEILIKDYFAAHPEINLLYADEDRIAEDGVHLDPWFKSEWAPDTFLSTFYFGNVIAFRMSAFAMINPGRRRTSYYESESALREDSLDEERARTNEDDWPVRAWIYGTLCLKIAQADGGYTRRPEAKWNEFPIGHVPEVLFHGSHRVELWNGNLIKESLTGRYSVDSAYTDLMNTPPCLMRSSSWTTVPTRSTEGRYTSSWMRSTKTEGVCISIKEWASTCPPFTTWARRTRTGRCSCLCTMIS